MTVTVDPSTTTAAESEMARIVSRLLTPPYSPHLPQPKQGQFLLDFSLEALYGGAAGGGKGSCIVPVQVGYDASMGAPIMHETQVVTPFGMKKFADVKVGDQLSNPDGSVQRVIALHDLGERDVFKVTFIDGAWTLVTGDHLWLINYSGKKYKADRRYVTDDGWTGKNSAVIRTTEQLATHLADCDTRVEQGKRPYWPLIPLTTPVEFTTTARYPEGLRPIQPYALGVLIGDGSLSRQSVTFYSADAEIAARIEQEGLSCRYSAHPTKIAQGTYTLDRAIRADLLRLGLCVTAEAKHLPKPYTHGPVETRWALMQGLMDTDGTVDSRGHCSYTTISSRLARDVQWLAWSLGFKATITDRIPTFIGTDGQPKEGQRAYTVLIIGDNTVDLFHLFRKKTRCKVGINGGDRAKRRMISIEKVADGVPARCITVDNPNGLYITDDFIVTHNSDALLMAALQFVDVPGYAALLLRKSFADLSMPGALMERADGWLRGSPAKWNEIGHTWTFPSGATITFGYIQNVNDRLKYQGAEFQFVGFDELTQFRESDYRYLFSRVRRPNDPKLAISRVPIRIRGATNPGGPGHHWVYNRFVAPWEEAKKQGVAPKRAFYPATVHDNKFLDTTEYLQSLAELDPVTRAQLEAGNWNIRPEGRLFKRHWFQLVDQAADDCKWVRYWDLAATEKNPQNDPDWTAGALLGWSPSERSFYLGHMVHFRDTPLINEKTIAQTAANDRFQRGHVPIYMEQEPGASGKNVISYYRNTVLVPYEFNKDLPSGDKTTRAMIVANKAEAGMLKVVRGTWCEEFLDEIEIFPDGEHDDQVDAVSGAMARLVARHGLFTAVAAHGLPKISTWAMRM